MERNRVTHPLRPPVRRILLLTLLILVAGLAAAGTLQARGRRAPVYLGPNGNIGAWLGNGPLFGFDAPFGIDFPFGDRDEDEDDNSGGGSWGGWEWKNDDNGGWEGGGAISKGCLKETATSDYSQTVWVSMCTCRVKFFNGQREGEYADGNCAVGKPIDSNCEVPGDCCMGVVPGVGTGG